MFECCNVVVVQLYHNIGLERGISLSSLVHWPGMLEEAGSLLASLGVDTADMRQLQEVSNSPDRDNKSRSLPILFRCTDTRCMGSDEIRGQGIFETMGQWGFLSDYTFSVHKRSK